MYQQHSGYWKPDGEGIEDIGPLEWAAALNLLGGGKERAFRRQALDRLCEVHQQLSPFKFIVYSGWAAAELRPVARA